MKKVIQFLTLLSILLNLTGLSLAIENNLGASLRLRQEVWDNVVSLGVAQNVQPDRNFFRLRIQVWDDIKFNENFGAYVRLTTEPKYYTGPFKLTLDNGIKRQRFDQDEIVIDNLYLDIKKPAGLPVNFRIGRQDFLGRDIYGEGFLILDGTPGDGSRTFYFNAIKSTILIADGHSVDLVYVSNPKTDQYLPILHPSYFDRPVGGLYINHKKRLTGSNEQGFWIYGRHKVADFLNLEPYYIYKKEQEYSTVQEKYINTFGARAVAKFGDFSLRGELAKQTGKYELSGNRISGLGGYAFASYTAKKCPLTPTLEAGYVYLSGDKVGTNKDEGFNPLFSRAPQWNELLIYTLVPETAAKGGPIPGYWTNIHALITKLKLIPMKDMGITLSYQHFWADERTNITTGAFAPMFSNSGKNRGDLWAIVGTYKFTKSLDGMIQVEYFEPGNFYGDSTKSAAFIRWQLQWRI